MAESAEPTAAAAREPSVWRRVAPFIALTFTLTWLLDLALALRGGYQQTSTIVVLQLQMLLPAASAIVLGLTSARFGPAGVRESTGRARTFFWAFLAFTLLYVVLAAAALAVPDLAAAVAGVSSLFALASVLLVVVLRLARGRESFARAGLTFGKPIHWLLFGLGVIAFYFAMTALNYAFGLGASPDLGPYLAQASMSAETFLIAAFVQSAIVNSFLGIVIAFGEEYGWRGFLQGELVRIGRVRGVLAVGLIWGVWHTPVIVMGHNYPGYPVVGVFLMVAYTTLLAFVLGYAMLKTGSIWLVAFLHALNNQTLSYLFALVYAPRDPVFSFGVGVYGVVALTVVVALILRDQVWRDRPQAAGFGLGQVGAAEGR